MEQASRLTPSRLVAAGAFLAATVVVVVVGLVVGGAIQVGTLPPPPPASVPGGAIAGPPTTGPDVAPGAARYEVSGDGPADKIEYAIEGGESDEVAVTLPWRKSTGADYLSLTATRGAGAGSITCRITGFGRVLAEQTATGPYATCYASELASE